MRVIKIPYGTEQWYEFRKNGIGGSEISSVLGLNPYKPAIELFYEKLGVLPEKKDSEAMFWGRELEDKIAEIWQYYDINGEYIQNRAQNRIVRKCRKVNGYVVNDKYEWLFYSPDRIINKGQIKLTDGKVNHGQGILEIKTAHQYVVKQWEAEIPPQYIVQVMHGFVVTGFEYGEIALFDNMRSLKVYPFEKSEVVCREIIEKSREFWYERVLPAREIADKYGFTDIITQDVPAEIQRLEPPSEGNDRYIQFLKENFQREPIEIAGTEDEYELALRMKMLQEKTKDLKTEIDSIKSELAKVMKDRGCQVISFGDYGKVVWKDKFYNRVKPVNHDNSN